MVLWFQGSSLDHIYLRLSQSETVVRSLKLACFELRNNVSLDKGPVMNYIGGGGGGRKVYDMGKSRVQNCLRSSLQNKTFLDPLSLSLPNIIDDTGD